MSGSVEHKMAFWGYFYLPCGFFFVGQQHTVEKESSCDVVALRSHKKLKYNTVFAPGTSYSAAAAD